MYIRGLVQSLILHDTVVLNQRSIKQFLFDSLEEMVLPASMLIDTANDDVEAPQDPRFQIVGRMDTFISRTADVSYSAALVVRTDTTEGIL